MHIIIGVITAIAGLIWALNRLQQSGVDLNAWNPFVWLRRRKWEKTMGTKPIHRLERPIEAAALLMLAVTKSDGEITQEEKTKLLSLFESEFKLDAGQSKDLLLSSSYLLRDEWNIAPEVPKVLEPSTSQFEARQVDSLIGMLEALAGVGGPPDDTQMEIVTQVKNYFQDDPASGQW